MIQITSQSRIFVATKAIDFRCGIDGLCGQLKNKWEQDPFSGAYFLFCNKKRTSLKILLYDAQGFWLCQKRLSQGKFSWWPESDEDISEMDVKNFLLLVWNGQLEKVRFQSNWKDL